MSVYNEDNKSRELCMREGGLYVGPWTTLGPIGPIELSGVSRHVGYARNSSKSYI